MQQEHKILLQNKYNSSSPTTPKHLFLKMHVQILWKLCAITCCLCDTTDPSVDVPKRLQCAGQALRWECVFMDSRLLQCAFPRCRRMRVLVSIHLCWFLHLLLSRLPAGRAQLHPMSIHTHSACPWSSLKPCLLFAQSLEHIYSPFNCSVLLHPWALHSFAGP